MFELWQVHRRAVLIVTGLFAGLLMVLGLTAVVVHMATPPSRTRQAEPTRPARVHRAMGHPPAGHAAAGSATTSGRLASDAGYWDAIPPIQPAVSASFAAIAPEARTDPAAYAQAFVTELFTRDYATATRAQLLGWVQAEDAPLHSARYPARDGSKVLADSLTDQSWDGASATPVPSVGVWQVLAGEDARDTVSAVSVRTDPQWESMVAVGYSPPDPLMTVQDVTFCVTRESGPAGPAGHPSTGSFEASIAVQLGSSPLGGYGAAATNNYVSEPVG